MSTMIPLSKICNPIWLLFLRPQNGSYKWKNITQRIHRKFNLHQKLSLLNTLFNRIFRFFYFYKIVETIHNPNDCVVRLLGIDNNDMFRFTGKLIVTIHLDPSERLSIRGMSCQSTWIWRTGLRECSMEFLIELLWKFVFSRSQQMEIEKSNFSKLEI